LGESLLTYFNFAAALKPLRAAALTVVNELGPCPARVQAAPADLATQPSARAEAAAPMSLPTAYASSGAHRDPLLG
jgi:hypothetical protein